MSRREIAGSSEILGTFVGNDEVQAALEGSHSDRAAIARRLAGDALGAASRSSRTEQQSTRRNTTRRSTFSRAQRDPVDSDSDSDDSSGYNSHLQYVRGDEVDRGQRGQGTSRPRKPFDPRKATYAVYLKGEKSLIRVMGLDLVFSRPFTNYNNVPPATYEGRALVPVRNERGILKYLREV